MTEPRRIGPDDMPKALRKKGIPTTHKHRLYRSRLEARWAAMFDLMGWDYEYEPFDLKGWIPDFAIMGEPGMLVEIKPADKQADFASAIDKIEKADPKRDILLLGYRLPVDAEEYAGALGWLIEYDHYGYRNGVGPAMAGLNKNQQIDVFHEWGSFAYRISGEYDGDGHLRPVTQSYLDMLWAKAGNEVQWKKPK